MINNIGKFREKLANDEVCIGAGITFNDPIVTEALAPAMDFLWIDLEHNPISMNSLIGHLVAARAAGTAALVRAPGSDINVIKRILDAGAEGLICPQVESAAEVRRVVAACRYAPTGKRGWGPRRPSDYGRRSAEQVKRESNEELFVAVQIENTFALEELDEIAKIDGLDSLALGPYDLSISLGHQADFDHPIVRDAIKRIIDTAKNAGLHCGTGEEGNVKSAVRWAQMGVRWIQAGGDFSYMIDAAEHLVKNVKELS